MRLFSRLFLVALASIPPPARAGAFLFPEGEGQAIVTTTFSTARDVFNERGRLVSTPSYRKFETQTYVEYGVTDWLTMVAEGTQMTFHGAASKSDYLNELTQEARAGAPLTLTAPAGPHYSGLGLGALGARTQLLQAGDNIISLEAKLRAATPRSRQYLDMKELLQADVRLQLGRSTELFGFKGFLDTAVGYRSGGQNGAEIRIDLTYGLRPCDGVLLLAQSFSAATPRVAATSFVASQKFEGSVVYDLTKNFALQFGVIAAISGVNSPAERGLIAAGWVRF